MKNPYLYLLIVQSLGVRFSEASAWSVSKRLSDSQAVVELMNSVFRHSECGPLRAETVLRSCREQVSIRCTGGGGGGGGWRRYGTLAVLRKNASSSATPLYSVTVILLLLLLGVWAYSSEYLCRGLPHRLRSATTPYYPE